MLWRSWVLGLMAALILSPVGAATAGEAKPKDGKDDPKAQLQFDMSPVALPVVYHSVIVNYVFVKVRFVTGKPGDSAIVKAKEPYLRDTLVRSTSHTIYNTEADLNRIDSVAVQKLLATTVDGLVGKGVVKQVLIIDQVPQKALPRPNS